MGKMSARKTRFGACLWVLTLQYFVAEAVSISRWQGSYSLSRNYISDLGAAGCGVVATGLTETTESVCSPLHALMNASFVLQGLLITCGAVLVWPFFPRGFLWAIALLLIAASGLGVLAVGFSPEDTTPKLHFLGAVENFVCCNAGMAIMGVAMSPWRRSTRNLGLVALVFGIVGLTGIGLMAMHLYLGLEVGGMERLVAYPFPLWLASMGVLILASNGAWPSDGNSQPISDRV
jgi:hypothetical membrane protein